MVSKKTVWIIVILLILVVLVLGFRNWSKIVSDGGQGTSENIVNQELSSAIENSLLNEETDDISLEDVAE